MRLDIRLVLSAAVLAGMPTVLLAGAAGISEPAVTQSFGVNISEALLNPGAPGQSEAALRQEVALILHDARAIGAGTVRWMASDVWPQWACGKDPENQASGVIDPNWFALRA